MDNFVTVFSREKTEKKRAFFAFESHFYNTSLGEVIW